MKFDQDLNLGVDNEIQELSIKMRISFFWLCLWLKYFSFRALVPILSLSINNLQTFNFNDSIGYCPFKELSEIRTSSFRLFVYVESKFVL